MKQVRVSLWVRLAVCWSVLTGAVAMAAEEARQLDDVVVTATRLEIPVEQIGNTISVVTSEDLQRARVEDVADALRLVPGVDVSRSGGAGQRVDVYLRGGEPGFVRVMLDGIPMNDPSELGTAYDFSSLTVDNIERIEVLRGPQSPLYGSDAMSGVISITTRKGQGAPQGSVSAEGGSYKTLKGAADISGSTEPFNYSLSYAHFETDGFSATRDSSEADGSRNETVSTRLGADIGRQLELSLFVRHVQAQADYDSYDEFWMPSDAGSVRREETYARAEALARLLDEKWEQKLGVSCADHHRDFLDAPGLPDEYYDGRVLSADWQNNYFLNDIHTLTAGADWRQDQMNSSSCHDQDADTFGFFAQDQISLMDRWFTTLGGRLDDHSAFGSKATWRLASAYLLPETGTRLKASYGSGFKAPSLYALYASDLWTIGNPDLDPQTSRGWDAGVEQDFLDKKVQVGCDYFQIDYDDLIGWVSESYDAPGTYGNIRSARSRGVELHARIRPAEDLTLRLNYTRQNNWDDSDGKNFEQRVPRNKAGASLDYALLHNLTCSLYGRYVGSRPDLNDVELDDYTVFDLAASWAVSVNLEVYGRVENLLDEDYEEMYGYNTAGLSGHLGMKVAF